MTHRRTETKHCRPVQILPSDNATQNQNTRRDYKHKRPLQGNTELIARPLLRSRPDLFEFLPILFRIGHCASTPFVQPTKMKNEK